MCSICFINRKYKGYKFVTECEHIFCSMCLMKWLRNKDNYNQTCPVCRKNIHKDFDKMCEIKESCVTTRIGSARKKILTYLILYDRGNQTEIEFRTLLENVNKHKIEN